MDEFTHGGTPPTLWATKKVRAPTWNSQVVDWVRIKRLCRQIEKLSWMLELMEPVSEIDLEEAGFAWQYELYEQGKLE